MNCQCVSKIHERQSLHEVSKCEVSATLRVKFTPKEVMPFRDAEGLTLDLCGRCYGHIKKMYTPEEMQVVASGPTYRELMAKESEAQS